MFFLIIDTKLIELVVSTTGNFCRLTISPPPPPSAVCTNIVNVSFGFGSPRIVCDSAYPVSSTPSNFFFSVTLLRTDDDDDDDVNLNIDFDAVDSRLSESLRCLFWSPVSSNLYTTASDT
ncbi:hypothetical protein AX774_g4526 [Zancudomyces culisetae]|uniref:Uncharacterized protein n=1 Tax=Zancudomyces culisetae TaxID=1213189 RepID=A0A1R1PM51_ZANCU|nr:hypothetical protein AX774_g4526 [Zancudomyces culisetae]|eukprot:OMH82013.1 hypothetical protein AX774_g4526 [Zancudomyces culisetae]